MILDKAGFDLKISIFFSNYLINRKTQYMWYNFVSPFFRTDVGIGQRSTLSSILLTLYISLIFHIFEKRAKNIISNISVLFLSFVDNSLFISQEKIYEKSNTLFFYSYNIINSLFNQFSFIIEYKKSKVFHFSRSTRTFNSPSLDLSLLEGLLL